MICALVDAAGNVLETRRDIDPATVITKDGFRWVILEQQPKPEFDPSTHVCEQTEALVKNKLVRGWSVRAKTADEVDAIKTAEVDRVQGVVLKVILDHENRIRAIEGKGAVTAAQFKTAIKARI